MVIGATALFSIGNSREGKYTGIQPHVEEGGVLKGMGLLKTDTMFSDRKRTFRVEGFFGNVRGIFRQLKGKRFYGYEIHSGITDFPTEDCLTHMRPTYEPGEIVPEGSQYVDDVMNVYGTFIHGKSDGIV